MKHDAWPKSEDDGDEADEAVQQLYEKEMGAPQKDTPESLLRRVLAVWDAEGTLANIDADGIARIRRVLEAGDLGPSPAETFAKGRAQGRVGSQLDGRMERRRQETVTVCAACKTAACWQGEFYCEDYRTAGTVEVPLESLAEGGGDEV